MPLTLNGTTGVASPGGDTSTSLTTTTLTATTVNATTIATGSTGSINSANTFGFKNRIINGGMTIDQRNAGASVTPTNGQYSVDRWQASLTQASKYTIQQNAGSVTPPAGFINYLGVTSSSAYSITSTDFFAVRQQIEGLNSADLGWGTANAKTVTLSFWVRSSLTGTFGGTLKNNANDRSYPFTYTINAANTWEFETITIPGDTTGTWLTTNGVGIKVGFGFGVGATYSATAGAWTAGDYISATGATSVVGTSGATFYITGVQFEVGSQATSFDFRSFGTEFALCQRYYETNVSYGTAPANGVSVADRQSGVGYLTTNLGFNNKYQVTKRTVPTVTFYSGNNNTTTPGLPCYFTGVWTQITTATLTAVNTTNEFGASFVTPALTNFAAYMLQAPFTASAEL
jgi:hypothetical protein